MKRGQILIDMEKTMSSVSLIEDGRLNEYYVEYKENNLITGNIYKGKVVNVLQGLQTAFVDIGLQKNAFLYVGETLDDKGNLRKSGAIPQELHIKEGDFVMVQVTKEETETKGARLTMNLSLPGRYAVYLPTLDFIGVSNKITDEALREKLSRMFGKFRNGKEGFIARTVCADAKKSEILREAESLRRQYLEIKAAFDAADGIAPIHSEGNLLFRTVRDMLSHDIEAVICNDRDTVERLRSDFKKKKSPFCDKIQYYESDYDMMDVFGISRELDLLLERKVALPSGGSLVIDKTEALTAIDVNTGRFRGQGDHEETVFLTNMEAAREIARQIRLRNIGGIIVVDFIDMVTDEHKSQVVDELKRCVLYDRIKTRVLDMSGLGLVEITRKKVGNELSEFLLDKCPYCGGNAHTHSSVYLARKIKAAIKKLFAENDCTSAIVTLNPAYVEHMFSSRFFADECENIWRDKRIYLVPNESFHAPNFGITGSRSVSLSLPQNARLLY